MHAIAREELLELLKEHGDAVLVDVRGSRRYLLGHLPRAINVVAGRDFEAEAERALPDRGALIVLYCQGESCSAAADAAERLETLGYTRVSAYVGGADDWEEAGLELTTDG